MVNAMILGELFAAIFLHTHTHSVCVCVSVGVDVWEGMVILLSIFFFKFMLFFKSSLNVERL